MRIGLTGGIGSGKSSVAALLRDHGLVVIDADRVAREVVEPGTDALAAIGACFGDEVITPEGRLDRAALAAIVFDDDRARADLEAITHPAIREEIGRREAAARARDPDAVVVVDHPLLVETGQVDDFDAMIVVVAAPTTRLRRLVDQRGMDPADVRARMHAQASDEQRVAAATWVIDNDGSRQDLAARVGEVVAAIEDRVATERAAPRAPS